MSGFGKLFKSLFGSPALPDENQNTGQVQQQESLILARYEGVCNAFEKMEDRLLAGQLLTPGSSPASAPAAEPPTMDRRAGVFYALAKARMLLAEQLHVAFQEDLNRRGPNRNPGKASQAGRDLAALTDQIEVLTRAAVMEATRTGATAGEWETVNNLGQALDPDSAGEEAEDSLAHLKAVYNGGLVLFTKLQADLEARTPGQEARTSPGAGKDSPDTEVAQVLMAEAESVFERLRPLASRLQVSPELFAAEDSLLHEELESQVRQLIRLLEGVAAELALPNVTRTALWQSLIGDPRQAPARVSSRSAEMRDTQPSYNQARPWQSDIWCMTSKLFKKDYFTQDRANRVLRLMWQNDPDPARTWNLYYSVLEMDRAGIVSKQGSYYNACPWTDIWRANRPVKVGHQAVQAGEDFCLHIEAEPDGRFTRKVITGDFRPTDEIDYCDTEESKHHGDDD